MIAKLYRPDIPQGWIDPSMKVPLMASGLLHFILFVMTAVGFPFVAVDKLETITTPITIEVIDVDDITQTDRVNKPVKPQEKVEKFTEPPPRKPRPPKMTADAPPDLTIPPLDKPPEKVEKTVPEQSVPPPLPLSKPKPPKPKPEKEVTKKAQIAPQEDFQSLLKNLLDEPVVIDSTNDGQGAAEEPAQIAPVAERMTVSELDALRSQLAQCWSILSGAEYAENIVVGMRVYVNPDRSVRSTEVLDQFRYSSDSHFRAAADAARRALQNPRCSPLALPPGKYEQWKTIVINFDPRDMLQ